MSVFGEKKRYHSNIYKSQATKRKLIERSQSSNGPLNKLGPQLTAQPSDVELWPMAPRAPANDFRFQGMRRE
jgi:hypothetical protein